MSRKHLAIAATVALLTPMTSYAQQAPAPAPVAAPQAQPAAAPARGGVGMDILLPLALLVVVVGAVAHNH